MSLRGLRRSSLVMRDTVQLQYIQRTFYVVVILQCTEISHTAKRFDSHTLSPLSSLGYDSAYAYSTTAIGFHCQYFRIPVGSTPYLRSRIPE